MTSDNCLSSSQINTADNEELVKPKVELLSLLKHAGANKELYTMKEVLFYLGQYIVQKQLYDQKQQHMVHCASDPLGAVLGVDSFSVKEPRVLFSMITRNLIAVKNPDSQKGFSEPRSQCEPDRGPEGTDSDSHSSSTSQNSGRRRRRKRRSSTEPGSAREEEECEPGKRHKSDSFSLTFDQSLSWCVIGGLVHDHRSSESSDTHSNTEASVLASEVEDALTQDSDSDSDNFSVEFEVESVDSDAYSQEEDLSDEDQVFEVTIIEAEEDDFDEDTEITEADYWKCSKCEELNPPLPRHCNRCWTLRPDWFPDSDTSNPAPGLKALPPKPGTTYLEDGEGLDVPDGKRAKTPLITDSKDAICDSQGSAINSQSSAPDSQSSGHNSEQHSLDLSNSQPSTSFSSSGLGSTPGSGRSSAPPCSQEEVLPELERFNSLEAYLPASCLEPCVICQSRPKNGCIVHGRTGHLISCYPCARKLKRRNKLCPVCREPIQSVVLTYLS
ncbi:E3 ubiquitin-protein ligase Mdm2 [Hypomesus transpacificus]|uniref:E3 ubiquitin-protein ligase Mdm2 n=1 Tax=Hypomesus transpacificus TaxID=137520 RepID=UPI001F07E427|nr:E3 ubiquitin-protein ligase Mdm2 [Hypomesus transpacificus]XP_046878590.1 E3 ubiquitin-protein ligase Mdm2 [Hypomesus transpacificus]XP_046878591.1 E3 ubiquitin-protein ligase Mdm2 [Hypomesus transpacificus]XP_046878592.1 E3 ubiquitin-protein ligase Mdm2 [Hypomesus transpacificus]